MQRRNFLVAAGAAFLAGCSEIGKTDWFGKLVDGAEGWHRGLHRALGAGRIPMAPEYDLADLSPYFRGNGSLTVDTDAYRTAEAEGFANWRLAVGGLVDNPGEFSLADLIGDIPTEERIYRFRCVEAWSMVVPWNGFELADLLTMAGVQSGAKYVAFETALRPAEMPGVSLPVLEWPYVCLLYTSDAADE